MQMLVFPIKKSYNIEKLLRVALTRQVSSNGTLSMNEREGQKVAFLLRCQSASATKCGNHVCVE